ncbi:MAG TPA: c-type cytochrome [Longimicrobiales bacterium]|nr:c-type cytochrome [Longimicrobiales bacterium]
MLIAAVTEVVAQEPPGAGLYRAACAACHGADGKGPPEGRKLTVPTPDLTDCSFATREPDADWMAVIHQGGPVRKFDETMPAFGESLSTDQIQQILDHVRGFCQDGRWPRGELNLPRSFFTEKAYPEDEAVSTLSIDDAQRRVVNELVYERRFGASTQFELKIPFGGQEQSPANEWRGGLGDLVLGVKQVLHHNLEWGTILSVGAELQAPTGSTSTGMGVNTWVAEPFVAFGKALPRDAFVQLLAEAELPSNESQAEREAGLRAVFGRTFTAGTWGRTWTPMLEVLVARELESGAELEWDLVPQLQVSLSTRQHVLGNVGVRFPVTETGRPTQFLFYILWDWFDGGFFDGW